MTFSGNNVLPSIVVQVGSADSVMGLSKALTEKLIEEALSSWCIRSDDTNLD